ncbi:MAG TPA: hypothetical protein VIG33_07640 [Pseudobdellovibrionaceae bacterium]
MARLFGRDEKVKSTLRIISGGKDIPPPARDPVEFFEHELLQLTPDEAVKVWNIDFISEKFRELKFVSKNLGVDCRNKSIGKIIGEIKEKQRHGKSAI